MLKESGDNQVAHITFFGGETLMNFPVLKTTIAYARQRAAEVGKEVDFSLTTNATLLQAGRSSSSWPRTTSASRSRSTARRRCRTSSASSTTAPAATTSSRRRSRSCCSGTARRPIGARVTLTSGNARRQAHLPAPDRGDRASGKSASRRSRRRRAATTRSRTAASTRCSAQFRELAVRVPRGGVAEPPSRLLEREGDARGAAQGRQQGVSLRRRPRPAGRRDRRRRRAVPSLRRIGRAQARHRARRHRSRGAAARSSRRITSPTRPTAAPAGRGRSARAAAITKRTRATATRRGRTCTTATGFAAGPTSACKIYGELADAQSGVPRAVRRRTDVKELVS